jgi:hypothetical protein
VFHPKILIMQIRDLAALFPPFREVDENEGQAPKSNRAMCTIPAPKAAPVLCPLIRKNTEHILPRLVGARKVQDEWLETLWNMMGTFVDLAWGTDSVQTVLKTETPSSLERLTA